MFLIGSYVGGGQKLLGSIQNIFYIQLFPTLAVLNI